MTGPGPRAGPRPRRFNGAAAVGPRMTAPRATALETETRFNGAAAVGPRMTGGVDVTGHHFTTGFNGAAAVGPRMTGLLVSPSPQRPQASMGPRLLGRG